MRPWLPSAPAAPLAPRSGGGRGPRDGRPRRAAPRPAAPRAAARRRRPGPRPAAGRRRRAEEPHAARAGASGSAGCRSCPGSSSRRPPPRAPPRRAARSRCARAARGRGCACPRGRCRCTPRRAAPRSRGRARRRRALPRSIGIWPMPSSTLPSPLTFHIDDLASAWICRRGRRGDADRHRVPVAVVVAGEQHRALERQVLEARRPRAAPSARTIGEHAVIATRYVVEIRSAGISTRS